MAEKIRWTASVQVIGGPGISTSRTIEVEAYDSIKVEVETTDVDKEVEVQPSATAGQVKLLVLTADRYSPDLTYKVNDTTNPAVPLDEPQFLAGARAVGFLDPAPVGLFFTNASAEPVSVQILVGRDATV